MIKKSDKKIGLVSMIVAVLIVFGTTLLVYGKELTQFLIISAQDPLVTVEALPTDQPTPTVEKAEALNQEESSEENKEVALAREEIVATLTEFNNRISNSFLSPGWLHISSHSENFTMASETFDDGTPIPTEEQVDNWYFIDETGEVVKAVLIHDTGDPNTTQIVVYQDRRFINLLFPNMDSDEEEDFVLSLDYHLEEFLQGNVDIPVEMSVDTETGLTSIILDIRYEKVVSYQNADVTVLGHISTYQFDSQTGLLKMLEQSYIVPDGSRILNYRHVTQLAEKVDIPPDWVLEYLN